MVSDLDETEVANELATSLAPMSTMREKLVESTERSEKGAKGSAEREERWKDALTEGVERTEDRSEGEQVVVLVHGRHGEKREAAKELDEVDEGRKTNG